MANICVSLIAVIGLKEPPEEFVKKLSRTMFGIDLDSMDLSKWDGPYKCEGGKLCHIYGEHRIELQAIHDTTGLVEGKFYDIDTDLKGNIVSVEEVDGKTWYKKIVHDTKGGGYPPLCVLVPDKPFIKAGVAVPRFRVETKWAPPVKQLGKASETFPDLLFSLDHFLEMDGPSGEIILRGGKGIEETYSHESWYLFDKLKYPRTSLLEKYMDLTLAQRGQAAVETARDFVKRVHQVIQDNRFIESPYNEYRDPKKLTETTKAIDALLAHCEKAAKTLTFEGVFLSDGQETPDISDAWPEPENCGVPADFEELRKKSEQTEIGPVEEYL
jgi:hypothetical protein